MDLERKAEIAEKVMEALRNQESKVLKNLTLNSVDSKVFYQIMDIQSIHHIYILEILTKELSVG